MTPIRTFWIILTVEAIVSASFPRTAPAAATAPVESIVPPIQAAPTFLSMPLHRTNWGCTTIISEVNNSEMPIA